MLKSFTQLFRALAISSVLLLIFWFGFPGVAVADELSKDGDRVVTLTQ
ncbi:MAG: hypothetical protein IGS38_14990 [Synechococcales cyanobacterium M58_A2018_015]|nr:hypothetical protein [Synechococcales cyanobacterium M58_A2018_015]